MIFNITCVPNQVCFIVKRSISLLVKVSSPGLSAIQWRQRPNYENGLAVISDNSILFLARNCVGSQFQRLLDKQWVKRGRGKPNVFVSMCRHLCNLKSGWTTFKMLSMFVGRTLNLLLLSLEWKAIKINAIRKRIQTAVRTEFSFPSGQWNLKNANFCHFWRLKARMAMLVVLTCFKGRNIKRDVLMADMWYFGNAGHSNLIIANNTVSHYLAPNSLYCWLNVTSFDWLIHDSSLEWMITEGGLWCHNGICSSEEQKRKMKSNMELLTARSR